MKRKKETLDEIVTKNKNEMLYIGAASSFFFIGTYDEYQEKIDILTKDFENNFEKTLQITERKVNKIITSMHNLTKKPDAKSEKELISIAVAYKPAYEARSAAREKFDFFKTNPDLREREVVSITKRIPNDGEKGVLIVIEGYEIGSYWTKEEYDSKK